MFVHFRFLRERAKRKKESGSHELTVENSNLTAGQIATAQKALRILGLEARLNELKKEELVVFLYAMGLNPTDDIIDSKLRTFKLHHKKNFTFGQLAHLWHSMLQDLTDEDEILKRAFQFFDKDGNGEISVQELRTTMHELGDLLADEEITAFMRIMDVNNDGAIGYNEFLATLKTQAPNLANGGAVDPGDEARWQQQLQKQQDAGSLAAAAFPNGTHAPQPPNVPTTPTSDRFPSGEMVVAASPFDTQPAAPAGLGAAGDGPGPGGAAGVGQQVGDSAERNRGSSVVRASSSTQMPAFPARRQPSLKAGLSPPPVSAAPEPLLAPDAAAAAAAAPLSRPASRRLGQSLSMSRVPSGSGAGQAPALERAGSQRRVDDTPRPGSGSGGDGADPGQGLRAPSTLDPGSGSEGTS